MVSIPWSPKVQPERRVQWPGRRRRAICAAVALTGLANVGVGHAEEPPPTRADAPASAPCSRGRASAISETACELARGLASAHEGALVVAAPPTADVPLRDGTELGLRLARVVSGQLGRRARAADEVADLTRARTLASDAGTLVHLTVSIRDGGLAVVADVYPVPARFWDRVRDPRPSPVLHAFAGRPLDPEVRSFLPPIPIVARHIDRAESPDSQVVALACDDLDLDGADDLVVLGRHELVVGRVRKGRFSREKSRALADLSPVAQSPLREPVASIVLTPGAHLDVGTSDRAFLMRLDADLQPSEKPGRRLPWPAGGCSRFAGAFVGGAVERCAAADPPPPVTSLGGNADAIAGAALVDRTGQLHALYAARRGDPPIAVLSDGDDRTTQVPEAGAQLAVADLDGDGQPELLASLDTLDPTKDALVVRTWHSNGQLEERARIPVPEGIRAVATCPGSSSAMAPIVIATQRSLWIVQ